MHKSPDTAVDIKNQLKSAIFSKDIVNLQQIEHDGLSKTEKSLLLEAFILTFNGYLWGCSSDDNILLECCCFEKEKERCIPYYCLTMFVGAYNEFIKDKQVNDNVHSKTKAYLDFKESYYTTFVKNISSKILFKLHYKLDSSSFKKHYNVVPPNGFCAYLAAQLMYDKNIKEREQDIIHWNIDAMRKLIKNIQNDEDLNELIIAIENDIEYYYKHDIVNIEKERKVSAVAELKRLKNLPTAEQRIPSSGKNGLYLKKEDWGSLKYVTMYRRRKDNDFPMLLMNKAIDRLPEGFKKLYEKKNPDILDTYATVVFDPNLYELNIVTFGRYTDYMKSFKAAKGIGLLYDGSHFFPNCLKEAGKEIDQIQSAFDSLSNQLFYYLYRLAKAHSDEILNMGSEEYYKLMDRGEFTGRCKNILTEYQHISEDPDITDIKVPSPLIPKKHTDVLLEYAKQQVIKQQSSLVERMEKHAFCIHDKLVAKRSLSKHDDDDEVEKDIQALLTLIQQIKNEP